MEQTFWRETGATFGGVPDGILGELLEGKVEKPFMTQTDIVAQRIVGVFLYGHSFSIESVLEKQANDPDGA